MNDLEKIAKRRCMEPMSSWPEHEKFHRGNFHPFSGSRYGERYFDELCLRCQLEKGSSQSGDTTMSRLKVSPGYRTIEDEFEASIRRAFVEGKADYISLYSRHQIFLCESAIYAEQRGWITGKLIQLDEQSSEMRYRLTNEGKKYFKLEKFNA